MTELDRNEALVAVDKINIELFEKYGYDYTAPLVGVHFLDDYIGFFVMLPESSIEFNLNDTSEDDRIFYEEGNKYESFYDYIKRKFSEIKVKINKYEI